ncbi:uncharacterized protein BDR25DRAFT_366021 [Lindgomyces ingoldianus]|uniref:Uncharacterized protein n=1 Tax=Lindgomyces ingoldianus TaxID=673940 RepID=A0ACB6R2S8_9PLEO|nr:uncharacterized protein BDR25DRAFT_366021 [Lindgomyces ingoldianus]KAF2472812.1 hypothetical protein BDR25DRAFT_366021 [Lindgomyces ingoldianus]
MTKRHACDTHSPRAERAARTKRRRATSTASTTSVQTPVKRARKRATLSKAPAKKPASFPTLDGAPESASKVEFVDRHGIAEIIHERFSGDAAKKRASLKRLQNLYHGKKFPQEMAEQERNWYIEMQRELSSCKDEGQISFKGLYPSLRQTVIESIHTEAKLSKNYSNNYDPVVRLLNLSFDDLDTILYENSKIWDNDNVPPHLQELKRLAPDDPINPDTPPPGEVKKAFRYLRKEGLPGSLLGEWQFWRDRVDLKEDREVMGELGNARKRENVELQAQLLAAAMMVSTAGTVFGTVTGTLRAAEGDENMPVLIQPGRIKIQVTEAKRQRRAVGWKENQASQDPDTTGTVDAPKECPKEAVNITAGPHPLKRPARESPAPIPREGLNSFDPMDSLQQRVAQPPSQPYDRPSAFSLLNLSTLASANQPMVGASAGAYSQGHSEQMAHLQLEDPMSSMKIPAAPARQASNILELAIETQKCGHSQQPTDPHTQCHGLSFHKDYMPVSRAGLAQGGTTATEQYGYPHLPMESGTETSNPLVAPQHVSTAVSQSLHMPAEITVQNQNRVQPPLPPSLTRNTSPSSLGPILKFPTSAQLWQTRNYLPQRRVTPIPPPHPKHQHQQPRAPTPNNINTFNASTGEGDAIQRPKTKLLQQDSYPLSSNIPYFPTNQLYPRLRSEAQPQPRTPRLNFPNLVYMHPGHHALVSSFPPSPVAAIATATTTVVHRKSGSGSGSRLGLREKEAEIHSLQRRGVKGDQGSQEGKSGQGVRGERGRGGRGRGASYPRTPQEFFSQVQQARLRNQMKVSESENQQQHSPQQQQRYVPNYTHTPGGRATGQHPTPKIHRHGGRYKHIQSQVRPHHQHHHHPQNCTHNHHHHHQQNHARHFSHPALPFPSSTRHTHHIPIAPRLQLPTQPQFLRTSSQAQVAFSHFPPVPPATLHSADDASRPPTSQLERDGTRRIELDYPNGWKRAG